MYQNDAEMLFPARVVPRLRDLRGQEWRGLVDQVCEQPELSPDGLAFSLMIVRMAGCLTCHSDSYRAMQGCTTCARQTVARFKGNDSEMREQFMQAHVEVRQYLHQRTLKTANA